MHSGNIIMTGTPEEVITAENIRRYFGVESQVTVNSVTGKIRVYYLPESFLK